jgi:hypothetical protein
MIADRRATLPTAPTSANKMAMRSGETAADSLGQLWKGVTGRTSGTRSGVDAVTREEGSECWR